MKQIEDIKISNAVKSAVRAYLLARANAELERERVDRIEQKILESANYHTSPEWVERGRPERNTDPKKTYLLGENELHDYLFAERHELEKAGYEIKDNPGEPKWSYNCPACVAESLQVKAEHILIEAGAEMLGYEDPKGFIGKLLCAGLEKYRRFIDLIVKMVVNMPDFKHPLAA